MVTCHPGLDKECGGVIAVAKKIGYGAGSQAAKRGTRRSAKAGTSGSDSGSGSGSSSDDSDASTDGEEGYNGNGFGDWDGRADTARCRI